MQTQKIEIYNAIKSRNGSPFLLQLDYLHFVFKMQLHVYAFQPRSIEKKVTSKVIILKSLV